MHYLDDAVWASHHDIAAIARTCDAAWAVGVNTDALHGSFSRSMRPYKNLWKTPEDWRIEQGSHGRTHRAAQRSPSTPATGSLSVALRRPACPDKHCSQRPCVGWFRARPEFNLQGVRREGVRRRKPGSGLFLISFFVSVGLQESSPTTSPTN